jgi:hypothetical protein
MLCDIGASVNLMSKAMFRELGYPALSLSLSNNDDSPTCRLID